MKLEAKHPRLVLKTTAPKPPKNLLARDRLNIYSPGLAGKSVIAIQASSGFGKTMMLAQWRREVLAAGGVVAWLSIDPWDEESMFVHGLAMAMQVGCGRPHFGESFLQAADTGQGQNEALTAWLAEVVKLGAEVLLVLDDVHLLPEPTTANALHYLLHNAPTNLKIAMSARKPLRLQVTDLISKGQYTSLDAEALRFRRNETIALLSSRFGARIDLDACARLHEITEGWPLGLQLALSQVEKSENLKTAIATRFVHASDMRRYFVESLVDRLASDDSDFLVQISCVSALSPALCEAITHDPLSAARLARLSDNTPILGEGVDSDWRRIHPLAHEFLSERFAALPEEFQRTLRERAVHWLAEQKIYEEAARLALSSGQKERAYELAEQCLYDVIKNGEHFRVQVWIDQLPEVEITKRPGLRLAVGWCLALSERHVEAARMVDSLIDDPRVEECVRCESAEISATAAMFADDLERMNRVISPWLDRLSNFSAVVQTAGANHRAMLAIFQGKPENARYFLELGHIDQQSSGSYATGWRDWILGQSHIWEGQVALAEEHLREALARAEEVSGQRNPIAAMLSAALAATLWDRNKIDEIPALLADRQDVIEHHTATDAISQGHIAAARHATTQGKERRAFDILGRLFSIGETRRLPRLCLYSLGEQIRLHALQGRLDACVTLMARMETTAGAPDLQHWGILQPLTLTLLALARCHVLVLRGEWKPLLAQVEQVWPVVSSLQRERDRIRLQLFKALALKRTGQDSTPLLQEAQSMARMLGLERILEDTLPALLTWGTDHGHPSSLPKEPVTTLIKPARPAHQPSALLTPKEQEILHLLARNMSNKEIAQVMEIGGETVKWHLKNLFDKFYAANRKHLLQRAQMLGVLDS